MHHLALFRKFFTEAWLHRLGSRVGLCCSALRCWLRTGIEIRDGGPCVKKNVLLMNTKDVNEAGNGEVVMMMMMMMVVDPPRVLIKRNGPRA
jgi:hypothetical protein